MISAITVYYIELASDKMSAKNIKALESIMWCPLLCAILVDIWIVAMIIKYLIS